MIWGLRLKFFFFFFHSQSQSLGWYSICSNSDELWQLWGLPWSEAPEKKCKLQNELWQLLKNTLKYVIFFPTHYIFTAWNQRNYQTTNTTPHPTLKKKKKILLCSMLQSAKRLCNYSIELHVQQKFQTLTTTISMAFYKQIHNLDNSCTVKNTKKEKEKKELRKRITISN